MADNEVLKTPFLDWYGLWPSHRKEEADGRVWSQEPPHGVRLGLETAVKSEVFLRAERPWEKEGSLRLVALLQEDGRYRLWYTAEVPEGDGPNALCYADSDDGFEWRRPELGLVDFGGSNRNNIIGRGNDLNVQSLFVDPTASPAERYKAVAPRGRYFREGVYDPDLDKDQAKELLIAMDVGGLSPEERRQKLQIHHTLNAAVSPDGIHWTNIDEPILDVGPTQLDTHNLGTYDPLAEQYVVYLRGHIERRRLVRRAEGRDFRALQEPRFCLLPDPQDPLDDDFYNPCYCPYPGGRPLYLMFPSVYHRIASTLDVQLAVSRDSHNWQRPVRQPIIDRNYEGGEYGSVYACPNLVEFSGGLWRLPFAGHARKHDFLDRGRKYPPDTELRWAEWQEDRLVGLEAEGEGRVVLVQRSCAGQELRLNYRTAADGWIKVELVHQPETPPKPVAAYEGFGLEEAETLVGDELDRVVRWGGHGDLSSLGGKDVSVRLHLYRAKVFAIGW